MLENCKIGLFEIWLIEVFRRFEDDFKSIRLSTGKSDDVLKDVGAVNEISLAFGCKVVQYIVHWVVAEINSCSIKRRIKSKRDFQIPTN